MITKVEIKGGFLSAEAAGPIKTNTGLMPVIFILKILNLLIAYSAYKLAIKLHTHQLTHTIRTHSHTI